MASSSSGAPPDDSRACAQLASACDQSVAALPLMRVPPPEVGGNVGARDFATCGEHGQAPAGIDELAHVAGPVEGEQRLPGIFGSTFGATPSSSAATSR
jgi:hypothetical protein